MPFSDVVRPGQELVVSPSIEGTYPVEDETLATTSGGNANEKEALISHSSWEDIATLFKSVLCFTAPEPSTSGINALFPLIGRHFTKLPSYHHLAGVVRPSHGTPESALQCTNPMLKYIVKETTEVVGFALSLPKST